MQKGWKREAKLQGQEKRAVLSMSPIGMLAEEGDLSVQIHGSLQNEDRQRPVQEPSTEPCDEYDGKRTGSS